MGVNVARLEIPYKHLSTTIFPDLHHLYFSCKRRGMSSIC